jgi:uncharacterized protein YwqG
MPELAEAVRHAGLERVEREVLAFTLPALRLELTAGQRPGLTRFGGDPDLPEELSWPQWDGAPLMFVGQLDLADLRRPELPDRGVLSFFYGDPARAWGFDPAERGAARVLHFPDASALVPRPPPPGMPEEAPFTPCSVSVREELTLPPADSAHAESLGLTAAERDGWLDLLEAIQPDHEVVHRLLGHADPVQGDMQLECQLVTHGLYVGDASGYQDPRAESLAPGSIDWRLLLQVDSDESLGTMWGDLGRIYFWIRDPDLRAGRFDATWHILQCT